MSNDRIKELIERLEKAPGPSRELDRLIEETLPGVERHMYEDMVKDGYVISGHGHSTYPPGQGYLPAHYTASIDSALTLVPEGHGWFLDDGGECSVFDKRPGYKSSDDKPMIGYPVKGSCDGDTTPAIALCIAALRAIASQSHKDAWK